MALDPGVVERPDKQRFEFPVEGAVAIARYRIDGDRIVLTHTEVPEHLSGKGIGSRLAHGVFEAIRESGRKVVLKCPFMRAYYARHPEYAEIVER
jgi:predicted GNAT family acetyltransferase